MGPNTTANSLNRLQKLVPKGFTVDEDMRTGLFVVHCKHYHATFDASFVQNNIPIGHILKDAVERIHRMIVADYLKGVLINGATPPRPEGKSPSAIPDWVTHKADKGMEMQWTPPEYIDRDRMWIDEYIVEDNDTLPRKQRHKPHEAPKLPTVVGGIDYDF